MMQLDTTIENVTKTGLSWTKRSNMVNEIISTLVSIGRNQTVEKIQVGMVNIQITRSNTGMEFNVTGNVTGETLTILFTSDGRLQLNQLTCDIQALGQRLMQLLLQNKQAETSAVIYC